jgi:hypothetical protein
MTNLVSSAVSGAVVQARPETPGAVAIPLATPWSRGGPEGGADGIDRSIRITQEFA